MHGRNDGCRVQMAPALATFGPSASGNTLEQGFHSAAAYRLPASLQTGAPLAAPPPPSAQRCRAFMGTR